MICNVLGTTELSLVYPDATMNYEKMPEKMVAYLQMLFSHPRPCNRRVLIDKGLRLFGFNRLPTTGPVSATLIGCCFSILTPPVCSTSESFLPMPPRLG